MDVDLLITINNQRYPTYLRELARNRKRYLFGDDVILLFKCCNLNAVINDNNNWVEFVADFKCTPIISLSSHHSQFSPKILEISFS